MNGTPRDDVCGSVVVGYVLKPERRGRDDNSEEAFSLTSEGSMTAGAPRPVLAKSDVLLLSPMFMLLSPPRSEPIEPICCIGCDCAGAPIPCGTC